MNSSNVLRYNIMSSDSSDAPVSWAKPAKGVEGSSLNFLSLTRTSVNSSADMDHSLKAPFICPITQDFMINPVILVDDGTTYEESALKEWLADNNISPITGLPLKTKEYKPNYALKQLKEAMDALIPTQISYRAERVDSFYLDDDDITDTSDTTLTSASSNPSQNINELIAFLQSFRLSNAHIRTILKERFESMDDLQRLTLPDCVVMNIPICSARKLLSRLDQMRKSEDSSLSPHNLNHSNTENMAMRSPVRINLTSIKPILKSVDDPPLSLNILLLGNSYTGKTCLRKRLEFDAFTQSDVTIGMETTMVYGTDRYRNYRIQVLIEDPSGMERYASLTRSFFNNIHAAILVFSATDRDSFYKGIHSWVRELNEYAPDNVETILVCNKIDCLTEESRAVSSKSKMDRLRKLNPRRRKSRSSIPSTNTLLQDAVQFAGKNRLSFYTTSAKSGECVRQCFEDVVSYALQNDQIFQRLQETQQRQSLRDSNVVNVNNRNECLKQPNCRC